MVLWMVLCCYVLVGLVIVNSVGYYCSFVFGFVVVIAFCVLFELCVWWFV